MPRLDRTTGSALPRAATLRAAIAAWIALLALASGTGCGGTERTTAADPAVPDIRGFEPDSIFRGTGPVTLTILGADFAPTSVARWNDVDRPTRFVSPTRLTVELTAADVAAAISGLVVVYTPPPGGGVSSPVSIAVRERVNPVPRVTAVEPAGLPAGSPATTLTVRGTGFLSGAAVHFHEPATPGRSASYLPVLATYVSPTELRTQIPADWLARSGPRGVAVQNPFPSPGPSEQLPFPVTAPPPVIASLSPSAVDAGSAPFTLEVRGTGFVANSVIRIDGAARATTFVDATQLTTPITARDLERPGVLALEIVTPGPGGGTVSRSLDVRAAAPVIASLPSFGATAGWPGFTLTVDGTRFIPGAVVTWNGAERRTTYRSASRLDVFVTTADVATPTVARIAVRNPSSGSGPGPTSAEVPFTVRALPAVAMTGYLALDIPANDLAWDPVTRRLYASVASSGGALANSVAAIDPTTGTVTGSVAMGSEPGWLVISDDGQYLHASVAGGTAIRRVRVAPLAAERQFSVGAGLAVTALAAVPGQPLAVAAVRSAPCCGTPEAPPGFAIYDDGAPRQKVAPISAGSIAPRDATTFYAQDFSSSAFYVYDLSAGPDGVAVRRTGSDLATWSGVRITYASGRLYTTTGVVIDPDEMRRVAALPFGFDNKSVYVDPALGRLFFRDGATSSLSVVDLNGYQTLGTAYFPRAVPTDDLALGIPPRLVRWGADGFAFRTRGRVYLFRLAAAAP